MNTGLPTIHCDNGYTTTPQCTLYVQSHSCSIFRSCPVTYWGTRWQS